nr:hypothetical protein [Tanacetum cinerariifolium]
RYRYFGHSWDTTIFSGCCGGCGDGIAAVVDGVAVVVRWLGSGVVVMVAVGVVVVPAAVGQRRWQWGMAHVVG